MRTARRSPRGQELAEYALALPIFLLLVLGIVDMGRAVYYSSALHNAARDGARYGVVNPTDTAGIESVVRTMAIGMDPADVTVTISMPDLQTIQVRVTYQYTAVTPLIGTLFGSNTFLLGSQATMRVEG
jgi:Flp pilus assembly protein TadG